MKKIMLIPAVCAMTLALTACGQKKEPVESTVTSVEPVVESVESVVEEVEEVKSYRPSSEIREATPENPMFQVGETNITLGESLVGDLTDAEVTFGEDYDEEKELVSGEEIDLEVNFEEYPFMITAKNDTKEPVAVRNAVITSVYADQGPFFAVGGIRIGENPSELKLALGEPFQKEDGESTFGDLTAYSYVSNFDDMNVVFFVSEADDMVVSFYERMPIRYITSTKDLTDMAVMSVIEDRKVPEYLESPYMIDVEGSDHAKSTLSDVTWLSAKVYSAEDPTREEINNYLVLEYEGRLDYDGVDIENLTVVGDMLEPSYRVYGYCYLTNAYIDDKGRIQSDGKIHEIEGVYADEENLINSIPAEVGYYEKTEMELI